MTQLKSSQSHKELPASPSDSASLDASQHAQRLQRLDRLEALAARMDRAFRIPFTGIRFGWDSVLGLVPGVGDTLVLAPSLYILHQARDMGATTPVLARMAGNVGVDWLVGLVPLVGDVLDVGEPVNGRAALALPKLSRFAADSDFATIAEQASAEAREDAMVQFWLERALTNYVTDEAVNAGYEQITQKGQGEVPSLDILRPQIEQELRRLAMERIRADLQAKGPEIIFIGQGKQGEGYSDNSFCTANYTPGDASAEDLGSEFAEMDLDDDGMVSQQEYQKCRAAAGGN